MERTQSRRDLLATLGVGVSVAVSGCEALPPGSDGEAANRGSVGSAESWPFHRGTAANTGLSATGGPSTDASPEFTGDLRNGYERGRQPPLVGDDGIYGIAREAEPYTREPITFAQYAYKLSREDGSEQWRVTLAEFEGSDNYNRINEVQGSLGPDNLYAIRRGSADSVQHLVALSRQDGSVQWEQSFDGTATAMQPVVSNGTLYHFVKRHLYALDTSDGSVRWESPESAIRQPVPTVGETGIAVYNSGMDSGDSEKQLSVLEPESGEVRWSEPLANARVPIPTIAGETVYLADGDQFGQYGGFSDVERPPRKIHALSLDDGSERWTHTYETDAIDESMAAGGTGFVTVTADRVYYALGFSTASDILGPDAPPERVAEIRDQLYEGPNVVALDRSDGTVVWRQTVGSEARVFRPMVAGPNNLYAQYRGVDEDDETRIYVLARSDGTIRGSFGPISEDAHERSFAVADGAVYTHRRGDIRAWR